MPVKYTVELNGEEKTLRQLKTLENLSRPLTRAMTEYLEDVEAEAVPYPPETQANRPPGNDGYKWYVRGFGWRTVTGKAYRVSEQLNKKWEFSTKPLSNGVRGSIENTASYAGYVQDKVQASFHAARAWKRIDRVIDGSIKKLTTLITREINKEIRRS